LLDAARIHLGAGVQGGEAAAAVVASELGLTHRELEILPLLAAGRTNAEIAQTLVISPRTVGVHVSRILQSSARPVVPKRPTSPGVAGW